jgi:hypothetical protein
VDSVFIDHCNTQVKEKDYVVVLILDGASHVLCAEVLASKGEEGTMNSMRAWMDPYQIRPKTVVDDVAFHSPSWQAFYGHYGISPYPLVLVLLGRTELRQQ